MQISTEMQRTAWCSAVGASRKAATLVETGPGGLTLPAGRYLLSFVGGVPAVHFGSVLVASSRGDTAECAPVRYQTPSDGTSYLQTQAVHDSGFTVVVKDGKALELERGPVDVPDYATYSAPGYPATRIDGGISLETLERQCMLLFPCTLLPGCAGIPSMIEYSEAFCRRAVASCGAGSAAEQVRLLAGTLIANGARWVDERSDDTCPAEMKLCRGDDCDGLSVSARALLQSVGRHCGDTEVGRLLRRSKVLLVAGTADLGGRMQAHMWVAVCTRDGVINCECTAAMATESHFHLSAYLWSTRACWVLVAADHKIGVDPSLGSVEHGTKLPASSKLRTTLARAYYHVVAGPYSDRPRDSGAA